jgi:hypothetical protein
MYLRAVFNVDSTLGKTGGNPISDDKAVAGHTQYKMQALRTAALIGWSALTLLLNPLLIFTQLASSHLLYPFPVHCFNAEGLHKTRHT